MHRASPFPPFKWGMVGHVKLQYRKIFDLWEFSPAQFIATLLPTMILSSRGIPMNLRQFYSFALIGIAAIQADCVDVCNNPPCDWELDVLVWCATSNECLVNGQVITTCAEGSDCPFDRILPGTHYEVPLDKLWPELRTRNDLAFQWKRDFKDESTVVVLLDGVQATEDMCQRRFSAGFIHIVCENLPQTFTRLEFDFIPPKAGVTENIAMSIGVEDSECIDTYYSECELTGISRN